MALAVVYSRASVGMQAPLVTVEVHLSGGLPRHSIVGLPEAAVKESKDRVRSALLNAAFEFPTRRITVNLAPADLPKEGGRFDLPMALGILAASGQVPQQALDQYEFVGELTLSGDLNPVKGILPFVLGARESKRTLIIPEKNAEEASLVSGVTLLPARHLLDVYRHLLGRAPINPYEKIDNAEDIAERFDLSEVHGQVHAKRALEIAAAGKHSLLLIGPPGTGKTMLASRLPSILPEMDNEQAIESAAISSISFQGFEKRNWQRRPFRSPHHSASAVALVGGGNPPRPGEISLAHHGVLFLDELPEFNRHVLESLREPMESGNITISRAAHQVKFPASFQFIAAMNPCPCGYLTDDQQVCRCSTEQVQRYLGKISGPLLDRIDMHVEVPRFSLDALLERSNKTAESSKQVQTRVCQATEKQIIRQQSFNATVGNKRLLEICHLGKNEKQLLKQVMNKFQLSARAYHRILKVARTIADLSANESILAEHISEALSYRSLDKIKRKF